MKFLSVIIVFWSSMTFAAAFEIPAGTRFVLGAHLRDETIMFREIGGKKSMHCAMNISAANTRLDENFERQYEQQYVFYNKSAMNLEIISFDSGLVPYVATYCANIEAGDDPEDVECVHVREEQKYRHHFGVSFVSRGVWGHVACIDHGAKADTQPFSEAQAIRYIHTFTELKLRKQR